MQKPRKLVTKKELKTIYGIPYCGAHIARMEKVGRFPKRVVLFCRICRKTGVPIPARVAWWADEVEAWLSALSREPETV